MATIDSLGPQFIYPKSASEARQGLGTVRDFEGVHNLFGAEDPTRLFGASPSTTAPWPPAPRWKSRPAVYDKTAMANMLMRPPQLQEFDPRNLHSSQRGVTLPGVTYYLGNEYERTGETYADKSDIGNKYPIVYRNRQGMNVVVSGHHRAAAALLQGRPLRARFLTGEV